MRVTSLPSAGRPASQRPSSCITSPLTGLTWSSSGFQAPDDARVGRKRRSPERTKYERGWSLMLGASGDARDLALEPGCVTARAGDSRERSRQRPEAPHAAGRALDPCRVAGLRLERDGPDETEPRGCPWAGRLVVIDGPAGGTEERVTIEDPPLAAKLAPFPAGDPLRGRSEEHTSELQSL